MNQSEIMEKKCKHVQRFHESLGMLDNCSQVFKRNIVQPTMTKTNAELKDLINRDNPRASVLEGPPPDFEVIKMMQGAPRTIDLTQNRSVYLWIDCCNKNFPATITSNLRGVDFDYCVNILNVRDLKNFDAFRDKIRSSQSPSPPKRAQRKDNSCT